MRYRKMRPEEAEFSFEWAETEFSLSDWTVSHRNTHQKSPLLQHKEIISGKTNVQPRWNEWNSSLAEAFSGNLLLFSIYHANQACNGTYKSKVKFLM